MKETNEIQDFNWIKKTVLFIMITVFQFVGAMFSFNSMNLSDKISFKQVFVLVFSVVLAFVLGWLKQKRFSNTIAWFIATDICILVTSLLRFDVASVINAIAVFVTIPILIEVLNKYSDYTEAFSIIASLATFVAVIMSVVRYDLIANNTQGVLLAMCGFLGLNLIFLLKKKNILLFIFWVILIVSLLAITKSRTSMLAFLLAAVIAYYNLFMKQINYKNILIIIVGAVAIYFMYESLSTFFETVFFEKWGNDDLSSGRFDIWKRIFEKISLLGHSPSGIYKISKSEDAHNSFIQIFGSFGFMAFVLFIGTFISILKKAIKTPNTMKYTIFFSGWAFISLFENLDIFTSRLLPLAFLFIFYLCLMEVENNKVYDEQTN